MARARLPGRASLSQPHDGGGTGATAVRADLGYALAVMIRYCPRCLTEFQPQIAVCSDCGQPLEDAWPEAEDPRAGGAPAPPPEPPPPGDYVVMVRNIGSSAAERAGRHLGAAGIPFRLEVRGYSDVHLSVRVEEADAAAVILQKARVLPRQTAADEPAVGEVGGPCPACGAAVAPGAMECPDCGLCVGVEETLCPRCGSTMDPPWAPCPQCAER